MLLDWAGSRVFRDGEALFTNGVVEQVAYEPPLVNGSLSYGHKSILCSFKIHPDGSVDNQCPCRDNRERGIICSHVVALGLELVRRRADPERQRKAAEELRRAKRLAAMDESAYLKRVPHDTPGAIPAKLEIALAADWRERYSEGRVPVLCGCRLRDRSLPLEEMPTHLALSFSQQDENILFVLEDISEGPARSRLNVSVPDFLNLLRLHIGKPLLRENGAPVTVNAAEMTSMLRMEFDAQSGELILMVHTELPFMDPASLPAYVTTMKEGWVYDADHFWPLKNLLPPPLHGIYQRPVRVERAAVPRFFQTELPLLEKHIQVQSSVGIDLFTIEPAQPSFRLEIRGSPASLAVTVFAQYNGITLVAGKADAAGHFALPDPADVLRYTVRNPEAERKALDRVAAYGPRGEVGDDLSHIIGTREVLNFLGRAVPSLRRAGWKIDFEGRIQPYVEQAEFATPVVRVHDASGGKFFDVEFDYEDGQGQSLSEVEIQRALLKGESFVQQGSRTILLDAEAIETTKEVFQDCATGEGGRAGTFRLGSVYSAYVQSSLDSLDGIDVESPPAWQQRARQQNAGSALEDVVLTPQLDPVLRGYQKEGVRWLCFLEANGFGGILADEMGLGKTLQTLAWLQVPRKDPALQGKPALIVCPTSLVDNWAEEAARFTPGLKVVTMSGSSRHERWAEATQSDLLVTSYALLRRDVERYRDVEFGAVILDEAQHIKNRSTQNAVAAKTLRASHRLVLTGTPIENSVSDLWSIMDFLMPGYLGNHESFRSHYEKAIGTGGPDGEAAQARLKRKLQPFLLRRLKKDVARDLPPKIERIAWSTLTRDQQMVYKELLEHSRRRINDLVAAQGFQRSRMEIFKMLLRLRQVCCHLDLLKLPNLQSEFPSGKMELFFELLDEALDGGHRVLVFSQFTSMLAIIRAELESQGLTYCYLDGSTKDRMSVVRTFNTERSIPLFLISLKAGGTGLNLTGADMVVHFDPWWNPAVEDQATDRAYRIGQKRTVYSVKLLTRNSIEEKVLELQKRKKTIIDATLESDEGVMQALGWDDVQELISL